VQSQNAASEAGATTVQVAVVSAAGRAKVVSLPATDQPVRMGVHGPVAAHYKIPDGSYEPTATTLDYVVGATVACLLGTFGGRLGAVGQSTEAGELQALGEGVLVAVEGVLRIQSIGVEYRLRLAPGVDPAAVRRAHDSHMRYCPVATSIGGCVEITTRLTLLD
jgi:uncharacterized OsmC-like protein